MTATRHMGVNLEAANYFAAMPIFKNMVKQSDTRLFQSGTTISSPNVDSNDWPSEVGAGHSNVEGIFQWDKTYSHATDYYFYHSGTSADDSRFEISHQKQGTITPGSWADSGGMRRGEFTVTAGNEAKPAGMRWKCKRLGTDHATNAVPLTCFPIIIVRQSDDATKDSAPFTPEYVNALQHFSVVRNMDLGQTNRNFIQDWADRTLQTDRTEATGQFGISPESFVDLCNQALVNPWFCIPQEATDDYVSNLASYMNANLDDRLRIYVELSNEIWNTGGGFSAYKYMESRGISQSLPDTVTQKTDETPSRTSGSADTDPFIGTLTGVVGDDLTGSYKTVEDPGTTHTFSWGRILGGPTGTGSWSNEEFSITGSDLTSGNASSGSKINARSGSIQLVSSSGNIDDSTILVTYKHAANNAQAPRRFYGKRSVEIFDLFEAEFGAAAMGERIVRVIGGQAGNSSVSTAILDYDPGSGAVKNSTDALAIAPYMGGYIVSDRNEGTVAPSSVTFHSPGTVTGITYTDATKTLSKSGSGIGAAVAGGDPWVHITGGTGMTGNTAAQIDSAASSGDNMVLLLNLGSKPDGATDLSIGNNTLTDWGDAQFEAELTGTPIIGQVGVDETKNAATQARANMDSHYTIANDRSLDLIAYEGGHHMDSDSGNVKTNATIETQLQTFNFSANTRTAYKLYLDEWDAALGKLFCWYKQSGPNNPDDDAWTLIEDWQSHTMDSSPGLGIQDWTQAKQQEPRIVDFSNMAGYKSVSLASDATCDVYFPSDYEGTETWTVSVDDGANPAVTSSSKTAPAGGGLQTSDAMDLSSLNAGSLTVTVAITK